jgi:hypothetical protein
MNRMASENSQPNSLINMNLMPRIRLVSVSIPLLPSLSPDPFSWGPIHFALALKYPLIIVSYVLKSTKKFPSKQERF